MPPASEGLPFDAPAWAVEAMTLPAPAPEPEPVTDIVWGATPKISWDTVPELEAFMAAVASTSEVAASDPPPSVDDDDPEASDVTAKLPVPFAVDDAPAPVDIATEDTIRVIATPDIVAQDDASADVDDEPTIVTTPVVALQIVTAPVAPVPVVAVEPPRAAEPLPVAEPAPAPAPVPVAVVSAIDEPPSLDTPAPVESPAVVAAPSSSSGWMRPLAAAAAILIVAAIGVPLGKLWLDRPEASPLAGTAPSKPTPKPTGVATRSTPSPRIVAPPAAPVVAYEETTVVAAASPVKVVPPVKTTTSVPLLRTASPMIAPSVAQPEPLAALPGAVAVPGVVDVPTSLTPTPTPVVASAPFPSAPVTPAPSPAPASSVTPAPPASPVPAPAGALAPFYESSDVTKLPQVRTRVEPHIADELKGPAVGEIVIVKLLVSQAGRPSLVSLLRRSKAGRRLDDAVVAAVKQWTFAPALRRGEPVSCWHTVAVTLPGAP